MLNGDRDYYRRRVEQELAAARNSSCEFARSVHADLAQRYSTKLHIIETLIGLAPATMQPVPSKPLTGHSLS